MSTCPNCGVEHEDFPDVCLLSACLGLLVHERETLTAPQAQAALAGIDVDEFWDRLGTVLDWLEDAVEQQKEAPVAAPVAAPTFPAFALGARVRVARIHPDNDTPKYRAQLGRTGRVQRVMWDLSGTWGSIYIVVLDGDDLQPFTPEAWDERTDLFAHHDDEWIYPGHSGWYAGELDPIADDDNTPDA